MIVSTIVGLLADKGLDLLSKAIDGSADKAVDFIEEKTGIKLEDNKKLTNEEVKVLKKAEAEYKIELEKLSIEKIKEQNRHVEELEDNKVERYNSAHDSYKVHHQATDDLSRQIMRDNLIIIGILVVVQVMAIMYIPDVALVASVSALVGAIVNSLLAERQSVVNFRFGSSIGSKLKSLFKEK